WSLKIEDVATGETGMLNSWSLKLYGKADNGNDNYIFTDELNGSHIIADINGTDSIFATGLLTDSLINLNAGQNSLINGHNVIIALDNIDEYNAKQAELTAKEQELS